MTWRIELADTNDDLPIVTVIYAQAIWKRLSKAAQEAVEAAYPDHCLTAHRNTLAALRAHGFTECPFPAACKVPCPRPVLTEAGKQVARWNVKVKPAIPCGCIDSLWNGECECATSEGQANG